MSDNTFSVNRLTRNRSTIVFTNLPKLSYMMTDWPLPGIDLPNAIQSSPFFDKPVYGDKLEFEPLQLEFNVSEYLEEWLEVFNWMYFLANPMEKTDIPLEYISASMLLYTSHNNPFLEILFEDIVPVSLGGLQFTEGTNETTEIKSFATFKYQSYKIIKRDNF